MELKPELIAHWPKLAWVAWRPPDQDALTVYHGPMVEIAADWCVEAVWAGDFAGGNFDRTDLVFGTGVRRRGDEAIFVTSGSTLDRLWHVSLNGGIYVSNTLPGLLACTGITLPMDCQRYRRDILTISLGLERYKRSLRAEPIDVQVTYYHNLRLLGNELTEIEKPCTHSPPETYAEYKEFLFRAAGALGDNAADGKRQHRVHSRATVSSGYDSTAAAVVAREAGCSEAVTIRQSNSHWRGSDSGEQIATSLGLVCTTYDRTSREYAHEESVWAATGSPLDLNLTRFHFPEPLTLVFTGYHGDKIWDHARHNVTQTLVRGDISGLGMCELRLIRGLFNSPVPYWGGVNARAIQTISFSDEMAPWRLGNQYDRPIPRRLAEEAGVERHLFGMRKKMSTIPSAFHWPHSPDSRRSLSEFLNRHHVPYPPDWAVSFYRRFAEMQGLTMKNLLAVMGKGYSRPGIFLPAQARIFHWANDVVSNRYYGEAGKPGGN